MTRTKGYDIIPFDKKLCKWSFGLILLSVTLLSSWHHTVVSCGQINSTGGTTTRSDRSSGRLKSNIVRRSTIAQGRSMNIPPRERRHCPTASQADRFSPSSVIRLSLFSAVFSLSGVLAFLPLTPHQRHFRELTTTPQSVIAFPTPESDILDAAEDYSSQEFQGPFPPLRRPLRLRPESSPARGLYLFEQPLHTLPTLENDVRMTVYALADGTIIVYNPVAPTEETLREVEDAFGQPDHIICPTNMLDHLVFLGGWADRFPRARFWGLQGVDLPGAHFTSILSMETFPEEWREELDLSIMEASPFLRECFLYHRSTKTVFAMDSLVLLTPDEVPNPMAQKAFAMMDSFDTPTCFVKPLMLDRRSCQAAVSKVLDWDFSTIYPTHGACPIYDGKNAIATAFDFLWD